MKLLIVFLVFWTVLYCKAQGQGRNNGDFYNQNRYAVTSPPNNREMRECYGIPCPPGTSQCNSKSETSSDYKRLITTMECKDYYGRTLNSVEKSIPIPNFFGVVFNHGSAGQYGGSSGGYYLGGSYYGSGGSGSYSSSGSKGNGGSYSSGSSSSTFGGRSSSTSYSS